LLTRVAFFRGDTGFPNAGGVQRGAAGWPAFSSQGGGGAAHAGSSGSSNPSLLGRSLSVVIESPLKRDTVE
jgi:hypothetical protein